MDARRGWGADVTRQGSCGGWVALNTILPYIQTHKQNSTSTSPIPTQTKKQIPQDVPCFRHPVVQLFMAGFLPFSAIYIELHYIFNSIWGHKARAA